MLKHDNIRRELLMTPEEGLEWHKFKAGLGPIYPGYENFDIYMDWMKEKPAARGCVDFFENITRTASRIGRSASLGLRTGIRPFRKRDHFYG